MRKLHVISRFKIYGRVYEEISDTLTFYNKESTLKVYNREVILQSAQIFAYTGNRPLYIILSFSFPPKYTNIL
mgnify:FL=1